MSGCRGARHNQNQRTRRLSAVAPMSIRVHPQHTFTRRHAGVRSFSWSAKRRRRRPCSSEYPGRPMGAQLDCWGYRPDHKPAMKCLHCRQGILPWTRRCPHCGAAAPKTVLYSSRDASTTAPPDLDTILAVMPRWKRLLELVEIAAADGREEFAPFHEMTLAAPKPSDHAPIDDRKTEGSETSGIVRQLPRAYPSRDRRDGEPRRVHAVHVHAVALVP